MKKIIAFAGSNSSTSINHQLLKGVVKHLGQVEYNLIKLVDFPLPMYGEDIEREQGYPGSLAKLLEQIKSADGLIISVNEHNGVVSAYFKNVLDWLSRIEYKFLDGKKVLLLSTSNGKRGARSALEYTISVLPRFNGEVVDSIPVASYSEVYDAQTLSFKDKEVAHRVQAGLDKLTTVL
jgi:NAD(P)H-dependent FMN reductase